MRARHALVSLVLCFASAASAATPQSGLWWNANESGRGYAMDVQGGTLVMTTFGFGPDGRMQWYYSDGPLQNGGASWSATLLKIDFGQPLTGNYTPPTVVGNDGVVSINFSSRTTGTMTLPGGRQVPITRTNFAVGNAPQSLIGSWLYGYTIGTTTFAERFDYSVITPATSTGSGIVVDAARRGAAELQVSGAFAGRVFAAQFNAAGATINQYIYTQYLEEGRGVWVSPSTFNEYGLNAYRFSNGGGFDKGLAVGDETLAEREGIVAGSRKAVTIEELGASHPELGAIAKQMWARIVELEKAR